MITLIAVLAQEKFIVVSASVNGDSPTRIESQGTTHSIRTIENT